MNKVQKVMDIIICMMGLYEELKVGFINYNYSLKKNPIIKGDLNIVITYLDSCKSYVVQAADFLAGTIRKISLKALIEDKDINSELSGFVNYTIILPKKKGN